MQAMKITWGAARKNAGLTQTEAAGKLGITKATLSNYENYKSFPVADLLVRMCELYRINVDNIFLTENAN